MQKDQSKTEIPCLICSQQIEEEAQTLICKSCPLKLHLECLLNIFPQIKKSVVPNNSPNIWEWECFHCNSDKKIIEKYSCMFCDENSGFLVKIELQPAEFNETAKIYWGHLTCIEQRNSCEKRPDSFFYTNTINYIIRETCKKCKRSMNLECKQCSKFYSHFPCASMKGAIKINQDYCSRCSKKRKTMHCPSINQIKKEKRTKTQEEKKTSTKEPAPLKVKPQQPLKQPLEEPMRENIPKIEYSPQNTQNDSMLSPNDQIINQNQIDMKDLKEEYIPEQETNKKTKVVSFNSTTHTVYKTRAPDLLIELLINLMKFDRLEILRKSSLGIDFEKCEMFLKYQEKYSELHYNFKPETFLKYNDMSQKYLIFNTSTFEFDFIGTLEPMKISHKYNNIDLIHEKASKNMYFSYQEFEKDLFKVFTTVIQTRCFSQSSRNYITSLIEYYLKSIKSKKFPSLFFSVKYHDLETIVSQETLYKLPCTNWPVIPKSFRHYVNIDSYIPIENLDVQKELKAYKTTVKCEENCACRSFATLGDFSYEFSTWLSPCPNRAQKIECDKNSHEGVCKNMAIGLKQRKLLGEDVEEGLSWGIDIYTRKNIFLILPENKDEIDAKFEFIQNKLMKAINLQKEQGYEMRNACNFILEKTKKGSEDLMFDKRDREYTKILLKALNMNQDPEAFRIHSKGQGLICINKEGFKKNEFIVEYFGEIYSPCYWYEKQDQIKKYLKEKNKKNVLLDFYNIMLEIHKNDPKGYNIFFVDPIHQGNYSSRLSHSCDPNCGTVTTIVNGQYVIGMYAMKDINYGEELTFDYCSVTEDHNELKKAFCLCGSKKCRGKYLELIKTKESNTFIEHDHGFLERNKIILRASIEKLTKEDQEILEIFHLNDRILDQTPEWLKKWLAMTLEFVEKEKIHTRQSLDEKIKPELTPEEEKKQKDLNELIANSHRESRIQNLVITCDKVKYFLRKSKNLDPPFLLISQMEVYNLLWGKPEKTPVPFDAKETTVINDVLKSLYANIDIPEAVKCIHLIHLIDEDIQNLVKIDIPRAISQIRLAFLMLSIMLKDLQTTALTSSSKGLHRNAMADTCYFYAFTHTYFKTGEYEQTQGDLVVVRRCDVSNVETYIQESHTLQIDGDVVSQGAKSYKGTMLWGQLVGWFKQTVVNPEASLSQDRRGTLSNPVFSGSYVNTTTEYPFQKKPETQVLTARKDFINNLKKKPSNTWPPLAAKWSYKNPQKIYGTLLFESQMLSEKLPNYLSTVLDLIDAEPEKQLDMLENIEEVLEGLTFSNFKQYYERYQAELKDFKSNDLTIFTQKYGTEKRKRPTITPLINKNIKENDETDQKSPKLTKKKKNVKNNLVKVEVKSEQGEEEKEENGINGTASPESDQYKIKHNMQKPQKELEVEKNVKDEHQN